MQTGFAARRIETSGRFAQKMNIASSWESVSFSGSIHVPWKWIFPWRIRYWENLRIWWHVLFPRFRCQQWTDIIWGLTGCCTRSRRKSYETVHGQVLPCTSVRGHIKKGIRKVGGEGEWSWVPDCGRIPGHCPTDRRPSDSFDFELEVRVEAPEEVSSRSSSSRS
jgi:hypothetical protein